MTSIGRAAGVYHRQIDRVEDFETSYIDAKSTNEMLNICRDRLIKRSETLPSGQKMEFIEFLYQHFAELQAAVNNTSFDAVYEGAKLKTEAIQSIVKIESIIDGARQDLSSYEIKFDSLEKKFDQVDQSIASTTIDLSTLAITAGGGAVIGDITAGALSDKFSGRRIHAQMDETVHAAKRAEAAKARLANAESRYEKAAYSYKSACTTLSGVPETPADKLLMRDRAPAIRTLLHAQKESAVAQKVLSTARATLSAAKGVELGVALRTLGAIAGSAVGILATVLSGDTPKRTPNKPDEKEVVATVDTTLPAY